MEKRIIAVTLAMIVITNLVGCTAKEQTTVSDTIAQTVSVISETTDETLTNTECTEQESNNEAISSATETANNEPKSVVTESVPNKTEIYDRAENETVPQENLQSASDFSETTSKKAEPTVIQPQRPTAAEIELLTAQYINEWRNRENATSTTILTGLTQVARYRAEQLISDFSHNSNPDASTVLKYGEYVDMTELGLSESNNYYLGYDAEACAKGNFTGSAEDIARKIADGFKNSSGHWRYVGSDEYKYMAVGLTYDTHTAKWYCCVCMSSRNYGG